MAFDHEQLDVYRLGLEFLVLAERVIQALPKGHVYLRLELTSEIEHTAGKQILERIVAMLVKLARSFEGR